MSLVDSNTYIEPTAGTSLNAARSQFNNSIRSLLTNFRSDGTPTTTNITASGAGIGEQDGMLFRKANSNVAALYISDGDHKKDAPVGGNFTRVGIGNRVENGIASMMSNVTHYEIGELTATVSADVGLASNARLYLNVANNNTDADFVDVGIPPTNGSVVNTMIAISGVTGDRVNFAFDETTSSPGNRQNAHLRVGTADGANAAILLGSTNTTSNVSIVKLHGGLAEDAGISIFDQNNKYAPISANLVSQSTIQGTDTDVAPLLPAGSVIAWSGSTAPSGWLKCDGAAISRTAYAALFAITSTTYGAGDGSTTFDLPDLRGRVLSMAGTNISLGDTTSSQFASGIKATTDSGTAGLAIGQIEVSVGAKDAGGITVINSVAATGHTHTVPVPSTTLNYIIKT